MQATQPPTSPPQPTWAAFVASFVFASTWRRLADADPHPAFARATARLMEASDV
jgi:hypothetical protein